jgi:hypothetical protein
MTILLFRRRMSTITLTPAPALSDVFSFVHHQMAAGQPITRECSKAGGAAWGGEYHHEGDDALRLELQEALSDHGDWYEFWPSFSAAEFSDGRGFIIATQQTGPYSELTPDTDYRTKFFFYQRS